MFLTSDYESVESEDIKHVLLFELILKHTVFICHPTLCNEAHISA